MCKFVSWRRIFIFFLLLSCLCLISCDGDFLYVENRFPGALACTVIVALLSGYLAYRLVDHDRIFAGCLCGAIWGIVTFALSYSLIM